MRRAIYVSITLIVLPLLFMSLNSNKVTTDQNNVDYSYYAYIYDFNVDLRVDLEELHVSNIFQHNVTKGPSGINYYMENEIGYGNDNQNPSYQAKDNKNDLIELRNEKIATAEKMGYKIVYFNVKSVDGKLYKE